MLVTHPQIKSHIYSDEVIKKMIKIVISWKRETSKKKKKSVNAMIWKHKGNEQYLSKAKKCTRCPTEAS